MGCPDWFLFKEDARATIRKTHDFFTSSDRENFWQWKFGFKLLSFCKLFKKKTVLCRVIPAKRDG